MKFPILSIEGARDCLDKRRRDESWSATPYVKHIGEGDEFDQTGTSALLSKLNELKSTLPDPLPKTRGKDFEAPACALVHESLNLDSVAASSREFWLWLTFGAEGGRFADIVDWRFSAGSRIDDVNYGITTRAGTWEGLFARLWWRGNIGYDPNAEVRYEIAKRGDIDIWRSHIIRQEYGRCANVARALIKYQYPSSEDDATTLKIAELRELAKRLRIIDASMSYEMLDEGQINALIGESVAAIRAGS